MLVLAGSSSAESYFSGDGCREVLERGFACLLVGGEKTTGIKVPDDPSLLPPGYDVCGWLRVVEFFLSGLRTASDEGRYAPEKRSQG